MLSGDIAGDRIAVGLLLQADAAATPGDREKSLAAGCNDYIPKPLTTPRLLQVLTRYLSRQS
jgi:CheY-like chemotaxis protein